MTLSRQKKFFFTVLMFFLVVPTFVHGQSLRTRIMGQVDAGASGGGFRRTVDTPQEFAAQAIQLFLGLLATIFLILILMSGYWLITARGEEDKYEKAIYTIKRAVIGFGVVIASYALVSLVVRVVSTSTTIDSGRVHCVPDPNASGVIVDTSFCARFIDASSCTAAESAPLGSVGPSTRECMWVN